MSFAFWLLVFSLTVFYALFFEIIFNNFVLLFISEYTGQLLRIEGFKLVLVAAQDVLQSWKDKLDRYMRQITCLNEVN